MEREEFEKLTNQLWDQVKALKQENFYDYEKDFDALMVTFNRELLEKSLSEVPKDHRKKSMHKPAMDR